MPVELLSDEEIANALKERHSAMALHQRAIEEGMNFSAFLEASSPTDSNEKLDAYGRQLKRLGIRTRGVEGSYLSSEGKEFFDTTEGRALFGEFVAREWRKVGRASRQQRSILLSSDAILGSWERPYAEAASPEWRNQLAPAIPLSEIVARTSSINGIDYRSVFMTYDEEALRLYRVGESAEIPMAKLTNYPNTIQLKKYGRGMRATYEQLRRMRIDQMSWWIRWMAVQAEIDKVAAALAVLISGDGNANTAATEVDATDINADAVANELDIVTWLGFRITQFEQPYVMTTALMQEDIALQLVLLNSGTANVPLAGLNLNGVGNSLTPINTTGDGIRYGWLSGAPANKIVGFDNRFALEQITEIGSDISETERYITNQTEVITFTEVNGFAVLDPAATKILDLSE